MLLGGRDGGMGSLWVLCNDAFPVILICQESIADNAMFPLTRKKKNAAVQGDFLLPGRSPFEGQGLLWANWFPRHPPAREKDYPGNVICLLTALHCDFESCCENHNVWNAARFSLRLSCFYQSPRRSFSLTLSLVSLIFLPSVSLLLSFIELLFKTFFGALFFFLIVGCLCVTVISKSSNFPALNLSKVKKMNLTSICAQ